MADYNTSVVLIDSGMDCFEKIKAAVANYYKVVIFDIEQLGDAINRKIRDLERERDSLQSSLQNCTEDDDRDDLESQMQDVERRLSEMMDIRRRHGVMERDFRDRASGAVRNVDDRSAEGVREMAAYLRKIAGVDEGTCIGNGVNLFSGDSNYMVVVIDSAKYPESADHIRAAVRGGQPAMLTLDRSMADENRKHSLAGIPEVSYADRDEYPPASFREGGFGADVFYIDSADNRGSGSSFRWQLSGFPDGTRVRFRVI